MCYSEPAQEICPKISIIISYFNHALKNVYSVPLAKQSGFHKQKKKKKIVIVNE
jgi:hypothetical protein